MLVGVLGVVWLACAAPSCLSACMCGLARGGARVRSSAIDSVPLYLLHFLHLLHLLHILHLLRLLQSFLLTTITFLNTGGVEANSFCRLLNTNLHHHHIADELDVMQLSSYYDDDSYKLFKYKSDSFSILGLNCQCLNAKFDQISIMVQQLKSKDYEFDVICLQETWLSEDSDITLYQIQGYNLISQGKICSGLAIYVSSKLNFDVINMNINYQIWEGQFIEISNMETNKLIIIGNVYRL